jgi:hypothetical protein
MVNDHGQKIMRGGGGDVRVGCFPLVQPPMVEEAVVAMLSWRLPLVIASRIVTGVPWLALGVPRAFDF